MSTLFAAGSITSDTIDEAFLIDEGVAFFIETASSEPR
jgi:hypothetical protein